MRKTFKTDEIRQEWLTKVAYKTIRCTLLNVIQYDDERGYHVCFDSDDSFLEEHTFSRGLGYRNGETIGKNI